MITIIKNNLTRNLVLIFACLALINNTPILADNTVSGAITKTDSLALDQITRNILQEELELQRLNTAFRVETTLVSPWRQRRVFLYGEASAGSSEAAAIVAMPILYRLSNRNIPVSPARANKDRTQLVAGNRVALVGQFTAAGGDILELGLNFIHYLSLRKKGYNPKAYRNRVHTLRVALDNSIEQRRLLITNANALSDADIKAAQAESKLIDDIRDLSLIEYSRYHSATRKFWTYQNTAFLVDFAKNSAGASSSLIALAANHLKRRRMVGGAGLMSVINGVLILVTPVVGRVTGNLSELAAARTTSKELTNVQAENAKNYSSHREKFVVVVNSLNENTPYIESARRREQMYQQHETSLVSMHQFLTKQRERGKGTLRENIVFASIVGPPRVASGITSMLGGWKYYNNRITASRLFASGTTANAAGAGFAIFETARVEASFELKNRERAKNNLLPKQQFNERLRVIDQMEQELEK